MVQILSVLPVLPPRACNALKRVLCCRLLCLSIRHRVCAAGQQLAGLQMSLSGQRQGHVWIAAKGHQLLAALESVFPAPELVACGVIQRCNPPPSLRRYAVSFALALRISVSVSAIVGFPNTEFRKYPQVKIKIPPEIPPTKLGFRRTSLVRRKTKIPVSTGFYLIVWMSWDVLKSVCGGETGIRTLDTLRYTRFPSVRLQPLGHLSSAARGNLLTLPQTDVEFRRKGRSD